MASSSTGRIFFYSRDAATDKISYQRAIEVPFVPDNVAYDDSGSGALIVAGHPHLLSLQDVAQNKSNKGIRKQAPSWVISLTPSNTNSGALGAEDGSTHVPISPRAKLPSSTQARTIYQSDGSGFQTSSTGLVDSTVGLVYITGLYAPGLLVCNVSP